MDLSEAGVEAPSTDRGAASKSATATKATTTTAEAASGSAAAEASDAISSGAERASRGSLSVIPPCGERAVAPFEVAMVGA